MSAPLLVTELLPRTLAAFDLATDAGRAAVRRIYARTEPAYLRLNMITSITGAAAGSDGTSETLSSRVDRAILAAIRQEADVVLVGAESVRAEGYVVPRTARLAVVTASGDLSGHRFAQVEGTATDRVLVLRPAGGAGALAPEPGGAEVIEVPAAAAGRLAPADVVAALAARGLRRIVCEGGPSLASQFAAAGLIDEFCVTVAPALEPAPVPFLRLASGGALPTTVAGMLVDDAGFSYLRLRPRR